ncbi:MAG: hypothetical protein H0X16_08385 [Chloroflexi bacterium]|nr:hypothetical protein [Chloroflexota bacterium]
MGPYSPAIETGGFLFCSGLVGIDPSTGKLVEGVEAQAEQALRNLGALLEAAGLGYGDVAKTTCFLTDIDDFQVFNGVYTGFFPDPRPARSTVAVAALPGGASVEVEAIARRRAG